MNKIIIAMSFLMLAACAGEVETVRVCETSLGSVGSISTNMEPKYSTEESTLKGEDIWVKANHDFTYSLIDSNGDIVEHKNCSNK